jgi:hypothetical protein
MNDIVYSVASISSKCCLGIPIMCPIM